MSVNLINVITTAMNKVVSLASSKVSTSTMTKLYTGYSLTTTASAGDNWSSASGKALLSGNYLRIYVNATRSSASSSGNITNELVCTLTIDTGGKILDIYNAAGVSGSTGGLANFYTYSCSVNGNTTTIPVYMSATGSAISSVNPYINLLVKLNPDAYL